MASIAAISVRCPLTDNEEVPFLGWSEETGKFYGFLSENAVPKDSGLNNKFCEEVNETIHLRTASDGATEALISLAACFLFLPLGSPCLPVVGDRFGGTISYVFREFVMIHTAISLSDSSI